MKKDTKLDSFLEEIKDGISNQSDYRVDAMLDFIAEHLRNTINKEENMPVRFRFQVGDRFNPYDESTQLTLVDTEEEEGLLYVNFIVDDK